MYFYVPIIVVILLTSAAAGDLILRPHAEWTSSRRKLATSSLILLFANEALVIAVFRGYVAGSAVWGWFSFGASLVAAVVSLFMALFTSGLFRWLAGSAAGAIIAGVSLVLAWSLTYSK